MGTTWREEGVDNEAVRRIYLNYDYYIGKYEVTFDEYGFFSAETGRSLPDDAGWGRGSRPVINVSWWDAIDYCNWLSLKEGLPLPTTLKAICLTHWATKPQTPQKLKVTGFRQTQSGNLQRGAVT